MDGKDFGTVCGSERMQIQLGHVDHYAVCAVASPVRRVSTTAVARSVGGS
ncbi:hypothetical protein NY08_1620 [Rhodococcus sp. B7740]|nr:hypothetical protein NY08_1620 [Rhodococcus sp. B7740]